jgi:hypothetical protein
MKKKIFKFPCTEMTIVVESENSSGVPRLMITEPLNVGMVIDSLDGKQLVDLNCYLSKILKAR